MLATACEFHTSGNGSIDGFWQLASVDTLPGGGTADVRQQQVTWAFQAHLVEIRCMSDTDPCDIVSFFDKSGDSLWLHDFYYSARDAGDIRLPDPADLHPYGMRSLRPAFRIAYLGSNSMQLETDSLRLNFRRY